MPCSFTAMDQSCHDRLFSFSLCTDIDRGCNGKLSLFLARNSRFKKAACTFWMSAVWMRLNKDSPRRLHAGYPSTSVSLGDIFHTSKLITKWLSYQESTSKNFISREWRVVKTPSWLGAENIGLTGLAVPIKRAPDNPESWLASPRVCPVIRRGLYDACGVRIRVWRVGLFDFGSGSGRVWPKSSGSGIGCTGLYWY